MRRFHLVRTGDVSGCSGVGIVAEGAVFRNGKAVMTWFGGNIGKQSTGIYDSVEDLICIHGHEGRTAIEYIDPVHDNRQSALDHDVVLVAQYTMPEARAIPQSLLPVLPALPAPQPVTA